MSIDLFCDGHLDSEGNPTHDQWVIARWVCIDGKWSMTGRVSERNEPLRLLKGFEPTQLLDGTERLDRFEDWHTDARSRYRFACPVCGDVLVRRKTDALEKRISVVLDSLAAAGVSSLSLRGLTATLN